MASQAPWTSWLQATRDVVAMDPLSLPKCVKKPRGNGARFSPISRACFAAYPCEGAVSSTGRFLIRCLPMADRLTLPDLVSAVAKAATERDKAQTVAFISHMVDIANGAADGTRQLIPWRPLSGCSKRRVDSLWARRRVVTERGRRVPAGRPSFKRPPTLTAYRLRWDVL